MTDPADYKRINKEAWNKRTEVHIASDFYDNESFIQGRNSLNPIETELLGDIRRKSVLHLQCHFGQDTISLTRLGATATGVDLSDAAIEKARELARRTRSKARFVCCDIYDLPRHLDRRFHVVFASYGTIGWLPDMDRWAAIVTRYLRPGGRLVFVEFHPVVWMFDDTFTRVAYNYFNDGPIVEYEEGTYADKKARIGQDQVWWNHSLDEVIGSLLRHGMELTAFREFDHSPYNCFGAMTEDEPGKFRIKGIGNRLPMVYALTARRKPTPRSEKAAS